MPFDSPSLLPQRSLDSVRPVPFSAPRSGSDGLDQDIDRTIAGILRGRSPSHARALTLLKGIVHGAERADDVIAGLHRVWGPRFFHVYWDRPLLLLASLRAEALASSLHPLANGFATDAPNPAAVTREALLAALSPERAGVWCALATRMPQTNEVSRAVAWKWPADLAGCSHRARPLALIDIGSSGGLNLIADRLPDEWKDSKGSPLRVVIEPRVSLRVGFDLRPLDFMLDADVAWARACLWPGATHRAARFERAIATWRMAARLEAPPELNTLSAVLVPSRLPAILETLPPEGVVIAFQTTVRDYIEESKQRRYDEGMRHWLAGTKPGRAVWIESEPTSTIDTAASFAITAHVPDGQGGVKSLVLGRTTDHPEVVDVDLQAAHELALYFTRRPSSRPALRASKTPPGTPSGRPPNQPSQPARPPTTSKRPPK